MDAVYKVKSAGGTLRLYNLKQASRIHLLLEMDRPDILLDTEQVTDLVIFLGEWLDGSEKA